MQATVKSDKSDIEGTACGKFASKLDVERSETRGLRSYLAFRTPHPSLLRKIHLLPLEKALGECKHISPINRNLSASNFDLLSSMFAQTKGSFREGAVAKRLRESA